VLPQARRKGRPDTQSF